ncbi:hypothetical protein MUN89_06910 [Halobacillus salinarum]|uniref:GPI inositol-deacylase PGAP1-like alpha/beta domain-containing protein n=1 Tax=Halobacillus salinarum TaxID=2932257 RepID=A0ABY4EPU9_9BACI|nr:hypothetical protein [Halobacillus salinarum]UOQ45659.1 hypothetical protein MUN89_06910 [Halobacillus salinarum]
MKHYVRSNNASIAVQHVAPQSNPGQWILGKTPSFLNEHAKPLVFVHGLNSSSSTWWEDNDMYTTALNQGYQTAFVDLYPVKDMMENGELLAKVLKEIYEHFNETLIVIGHSKGGVDAQSALIYFQSSPYVERLLTLSSPHHGSPLADLAYSNWAGWLAGILGNKNDATFALQTGYMAQYRMKTDESPLITKNPLYTLGGTGWGLLELLYTGAVSI